MTIAGHSSRVVLDASAPPCLSVGGTCSCLLEASYSIDFSSRRPEELVPGQHSADKWAKDVVSRETCDGQRIRTDQGAISIESIAIVRTCEPICPARSLSPITLAFPSVGTVSMVPNRCFTWNHPSSGSYCLRIAATSVLRDAQ